MSLARQNHVFENIVVPMGGESIGIAILDLQVFIVKTIIQREVDSVGKALFE